MLRSFIENYIAENPSHDATRAIEAIGEAKDLPTLQTNIVAFNEPATKTTPEEIKYIINFTKALAEAPNLELIGREIHLQCQWCDKEILDDPAVTDAIIKNIFNNKYKPYTHDLFNLPSESLLRMNFAMHLLTSNRLNHITDTATCPELLYEDFEDNPNSVLLQAWKSKSRKKLSIDAKVTLHTTQNDVTAVHEGEEIIMSYDTSDKLTIAAVTGMINCHAIFIISENNNKLYAAHISPSQTKGADVRTGKPLSMFKQLPEFLESLDEPSQLTVIVCDKRGHSHTSVPALEKKLDHHQCSYSIQKINPDKLSGFQETDSHRYDCAYDKSTKEFHAIHDGKSYPLGSIKDYAPSLATTDPAIGHGGGGGATASTSRATVFGSNHEGRKDNDESNESSPLTRPGGGSGAE